MVDVSGCLTSAAILSASQLCCARLGMRRGTSRGCASGCCSGGAEAADARFGICKGASCGTGAAG
jgi:hypothetical protein